MTTEKDDMIRTRTAAHRKPGLATWRSRRTAFAVLLLAVTLSGCAASTPADQPTTVTDIGSGTPNAQCATSRLGKSFVKDDVTYTCSTPKPYRWRSDRPVAKAELSAGRKNAIRSAKAYLDLSGFSRAGLIQQLTSKAGEGFSRADATYAVDHVGADWNAEAVESAKAYLDLSGFSRAGLIQQLTSKAGDRYSKAQAEHAADKVGL